MIVVHKTLLQRISKLKPQVYNPRTISDKKFRGLMQSIRNHGFVEPIVVQKGTLAIIGGHQRLKAVKQICKDDGVKLPKLPCVVLDVDDRSAKLLNIALNNLSGEFDSSMLGALLSDIQAERAIDPDEIVGSGYSQKEIDNIVAKLQPPETDDPDLNAFARSVTLSLKFDTVEQRDTVRAILNEQVQKDGGRSGTIVHALLSKE